MKVKRIFAACTTHGVRLVFALQIRGKDDYKSRIQSS